MYIVKWNKTEGDKMYCIVYDIIVGLFHHSEELLTACTQYGTSYLLYVVFVFEY